MPNRRTTLAVALALVVGACSTPQPSPSPAPTATPTTQPVTGAPPSPAGSARPLAEVYAGIRGEVAGIRGLQPTDAVEPVVIDADQLATNLEAEFDATHDPAALRNAEDLLTTLGLLPPGSSLRALTLDFQAGQVAGYYSPEKDQLFVVSRSAAVGPVDEATYAHEFTHQLQDQRFDLDALGLDDPDESDRSLARLALVEGDATAVQTTWMTRHLTPAELGEVFAASLDPAALEAFNKAPPYLRETALFPYQDGFALVSRLLASGGYEAVNAAFADPPDSTEQVLHPDKYLAREPPVTVDDTPVPAARIGTGWSMIGEDTLGELILRIWLKLGGQTSVQAAEAAAGWGGDRVWLYRGPGGRVVAILVTDWDTPQDALEFDVSATAAVTGLGKVATIRNGGQRVAIAIGDAAAVEALGGFINGLVFVPVGS